MSKKVLIATVKPFATAAREQVEQILREAGYEVTVLEKYDGKPALLEAVADVDAMIVRSDKIDPEVLDAAKQLKLIVRAGAGYDSIDTAAAKERNVAVMNTPGQNANAVAELAVGLMVYMARGQFNGKPGTELGGKTLGIHAIGAVGRAVARIAKGFGMTVKAFDPYVSDEDIRALGVEPVSSEKELYESCQYVSLHIPATAETKQSVGKAWLSVMPRNGCLVNTARKEVIHEAELLEVMAERSDLRYVTDIAPSDETKAALLEKFPGRFYATPKKMGAQTAEANTNAGRAAANQIVGFFERGERTFIVNG